MGICRLITFYNILGSEVLNSGPLIHVRVRNQILHSYFFTVYLIYVVCAISECSGNARVRQSFRCSQVR